MPINEAQCIFVIRDSFGEYLTPNGWEYGRGSATEFPTEEAAHEALRQDRCNSVIPNGRTPSVRSCSSRGAAQ